VERDDAITDRPAWIPARCAKGRRDRGGGFGSLSAMLQEQETEAVPAVRVPTVYRDPVTWVIVGLVFGAYTALSVFRLLQLNPSSWDLGIFTEAVKQYAHFQAPIVNIRGAGTNLLGDHFSPAIAVLAPFFRVFPSAGTLLVAQALLTAASVFPIAQLAWEKLGHGQARAIAVAYGCSWGLQQMINFDFHEIAIAVPLLAFSLSALARGRLRATVRWALPLVLVKEDQGFTVAAIGIYLVFSGLVTGTIDRDRLKAGQFLVAWGLAWSFVAIAVIIPHFNASHVYTYWNDGGAFAPGGKPSFLAVIRQEFHDWPYKLQTLVMLLVPTAFTALRSPLALIAVPSLGLRFESTNSAYWGTDWHYNATVVPILFVAAVDGLALIAAARARDVAVAQAAEPDTPDSPDAAAPEAAAPEAPMAPAVPAPAVLAPAVLAPAALAGSWADWASGAKGWWKATMAGAERYGAAMMLAITIPLAFQFPLSGLWNANTYKISPRVAEANAAMAKVPDGATVLTTLDLLASLAARTDTYWIGNAHNPDTEYIVFDGQDSDYSPSISNVPSFVEDMYPKDMYTVIFSAGPFYVFKHTG
jgi:uncharacterized membrane protein